MYLEKAVYENVGPLKSVQFSFSFEENGNPKPIILVGENGSGKSTVLSNIVDAFYEIAGVSFDNAQKPSGTHGHQYYKSISSNQIRAGEQYMFTYLSFGGDQPHYYLCKAGTIGINELKNRIGISDTLNWKDNENGKTVSANKELAEKEWSTNVICYFGPDRYERPAWMGDKYYNLDEYMHPAVPERISGRLNAPISVRNVTALNLQWLMDIIVDSRADIGGDEKNLAIEHVLVNDLLLLRKARSNIESILSNILGEDVYFSLNFRSNGNSRFRIQKRDNDSVVCPTLDSLSTGQIALFNMFSTIVRYADLNNINDSIHLKNIKGIVVIDEIELHLHTKLQKEVLPRLIKLFPKIQFIITTHAPLFLLGMKEVYGEDHFDVYELPTAEKIGTEKFSEFQRAYQYLKETETYQIEAEEALRTMLSDGKAIIVTEGATDWKHLAAAFEALKLKEEHKELFDSLDFEFFKYEPAESKDIAAHKLQMGNSVLCGICENVAKLPQPVKYIFIADRDNTDTNKKLSISGQRYKSWGNNVYSLVLPIPKHREDTPAICIEHYYTDDEIKTIWTDSATGVSRRLYMGNEFDSRGIAQSIGMFCEKKNKCGKNSIAIIEGSSGERVTKIEDDGKNYALPKSLFAKFILDKQAPFDSFNFDCFISVFEIIKEIISQG